MTPVHALAMTIPPVLYIGSVLVGRLTQPDWMLRWRFTLDIGRGQEGWARAAACVGMIGVAAGLSVIMRHLGKQLHAIAVSPRKFITLPPG